MTDKIRLMKKEIDVANSPILYDKKIDESVLQQDWDIKTGEWWIEDEWLCGKNPGNFPGMVISKDDFKGNVMFEFEGRNIAPSTHDINFMWNGSWKKDVNERDVAYVTGLEGWWEGKIGIEKSPDYKFMCGTPLFNYEPGKTYKMLGGSIDGHCFVMVDGKLLLEAMDPDPIDNQKYAKIGFEAYCSIIEVKNLVVRQIKWEPVDMAYIPEFK